MLFSDQEETTKACIYCNVEKPLSAFYAHPSRFDRLDGRCIQCHKDKHKFVAELKKNAPPAPDYCECCGTPVVDLHDSYKKIKLSCDHDHETGAFRGWICKKCNIGIGNLGDTIESLQKAIDYLKRKHDA